MFANEVIIPVKDITKIKHFDNAVVFYTEKKYWVCIKKQPLPQAGDLFIKLTLKGKCEK